MADVVQLRPESEAEADTDGLFAKLKRQYGDDNEKARVWREQAREDFAFRDGDQWRDEEIRLLESQMRPVLVFNRVGVLVDAVVGSEIGNRREVRFIPRERADDLPTEVLTGAAEWFRDDCDAEDEESEAFKDCVTAGMGWTETRLDFTESPDGEPKVERVDAFEMAWDCNASKANLTDSRRRWRKRRVDVAEALELFPGEDPEALNAKWADGTDIEHDRDELARGERYDQNREYRGTGEDLREVTLVECQYVEHEDYWQAYGMFPGLDGVATPQKVELTDEKHTIAKDAGMVLKSTKMKRRVVMRCFLGAETIIGKPEPTQTGEFSLNCITGLKDNKRGIFYGIVRRAKDPQRWANKFLSQQMHILNSQAKGGIMAEAGAFADQEEAERTWTRPDAITWLNKGALSGGAGMAKVQPKPTAQFPAGFDRLMQVAFDHIVQVTGINMELLGMREATQPGVLEYQRRQSGITILATFFDSLRRYRKIQGRCLLTLIQKYLSDGRMIRIVGQGEAQYVQLAKENTSGEYDVIVDDSPSSPNEKEKTWQQLQAVLPMLKDIVGPQQAMVLADYLPLPASLIEKLKELGEQQAQQPDPAQQAELMKVQLEQQKVANDAAKIDADRQKAQFDMQIALLNAETERQRIIAEREVGMAQATRTPEPVIQNGAR